MAQFKNVTVSVLSTAGEKVGTVSLKGNVWNIEPNTQVMYDAVKVYLANTRQATAKTKKRDEVSGGGKKPWRQKGTGRARAGSTRSPIWVGGGTVFGPTGVQNFKLSQNRKEYNLALRSALTQKVKNGLIVVDALEVTEKKTKVVVEILKNIKATGKTLVVVNEPTEELYASAANLSNVAVLTPSNLSVYDLLDATSLVLTKASVKKVEELING